MASNENYVIRVRRGTANEWAIYNPILGAGELGYDTTNRRLKVGDGLNVWSNVKFATGNSFDVARDAGFDGTLSQWLESLSEGPVNTLSVGEVSTGPEPEVNIRGEAPNQIIDFKFPAAGEPISYGKATPTSDGLMAKEDKVKVDSSTTKSYVDSSVDSVNNAVNTLNTSITGISSDIDSRISATIPTASSIPDNDANKINKTGFYQTDGNTLNKPSTLAYISIIHIEADSSSWQMAVPSRSTTNGRQQMYTRLGSGGNWSPWEHFLSDRDLSATILPQVVGESTNSASSLFAAIKSAAGQAAAASKLYIPISQFAGAQGAATEIIDSSGLASKAQAAALGGSGTALFQTWVTIPNGWTQADIYFMWLHTESTLQTGGITFRCSTALPQTSQAWGSSISTVNTTVNIENLQSYVLQESKVRVNCPVSNDQPLFLHAGRSGTATEDTLAATVKLLGVKLVRVL